MVTISIDVIDDRGDAGSEGGGGGDGGGDGGGEGNEGTDGGVGGGEGTVGAGSSSSSRRPQQVEGHPKKTTRKTIATIVAAAPMVPINTPVMVVGWVLWPLSRVAIPLRAMSRNMKAEASSRPRFAAWSHIGYIRHHGLSKLLWL